jgi:cytochrome P450
VDPLRRRRASLHRRGFALTEARLILQTILRHVTFGRSGARGEPSRRRTLVTMPRGRATVTLLPARA